VNLVYGPWKELLVRLSPDEEFFSQAPDTQQLILGLGPQFSLVGQVVVDEIEHLVDLD